MRVDVGPEPTPVLVVLHTDGLTENSSHVFSKADVWDFEMDLGIAMVISTNIVRIGQDTWIHGFSGTFGGWI